MVDFLTPGEYSERVSRELLSLCDKISLALAESLFYYQSNRTFRGVHEVRTADAITFWTAVEASNWNVVLYEGKRLLSECDGEARIDLALHLCIASEYLGHWLTLANYASVGVETCQKYAITDHRYAGLLKALGRGLWDRQQYQQAIITYTKLLNLAVSGNSQADIWAAKYSTACCLEKCGREYWSESIATYDDVFLNAPDWPHKISASVNAVSLLLQLDEEEAAYELATSRFLAIPASAQQGASWAEFLTILAQMEVNRNRPDVASIVIYDAIEMIPAGRVVTLAKAHAIRALTEQALGNVGEAHEAIELAWEYAEQVPNTDTCRLLREVESTIEGR